jgi:hypothetical protein
MKMTSNGYSLEVCEERGLLINGRPPGEVKALGGGWFKASSVFCRLKHPKKVQGQRKRKLALMAATKRFRFSFNFKRD